MLSACRPNAVLSPDVIPSLPSATPEIFSTPTITPIEPTQTPTEKPGLSPEEVRQAWGNLANLDSKHQDKPCTACHLTENQYDPPPDTACLICHGGSYGAITNLTKGYIPYNPHDYHYTVAISCNFCHKMHEPQESPCGLCHEEKQVFKPTTTP